MSIWLPGGLLALLLALGCYAWVEARSVRHRRVELFFDTLPEDFEGYSVLYISDPHFQRRDGRKARLLARVSAEIPDLCVITGDLIERDEAIHACQ